MKNRFLLYIDVLGFSDMVYGDESRIVKLYDLVDGLNCLSHHAFNTIVFSDTVLIYNVAESTSRQDDTYYVMFCIEFFQDLLYRSAGKDYYFRSVLVNGPFEHDSPGRVERFYGEALVRAYNYEKAINSTGLFIDRYCNELNLVFPTTRFNSELNFVHVNQSLDRLQQGWLGSIPIPRGLFEDQDHGWLIARDVKILERMHWHMKNDPCPRVRAKHLMAWDLYSRRYSAVMKQLEEAAFDPNFISPGYDWASEFQRIEEGED